MFILSYYQNHQSVDLPRITLRCAHSHGVNCSITKHYWNSTFLSCHWCDMSPGVLVGYLHLSDNHNCSAIFCYFANWSTLLTYLLSGCLLPECSGKSSSWEIIQIYIMVKLEVTRAEGKMRERALDHIMWSCHTIIVQTFLNKKK